MSASSALEALLTVTPVPALSAAFTLFNFILSTLQTVDASKEQLTALAKSIRQLLATLNTEFSESRLVASRCGKPLAELERLLGDVHRFVEAEAQCGFLKLLFHKDSRIAKIELFHKRVGLSINAFQISSLLNIQSMLIQCKEAQVLDADTLKAQLNTLQQSNANLLRTLEINQNNTVAMMVSLQKQLEKQKGGQPEERFYAHTLAYLTSRSGKQVRVEEWMISPFEIEYGEEIGAGGFGTVYQGTWNRTDVAIKVLHSIAGITPSTAVLRNEIDIWSTLRHPNILQFLGANTLDDKPFIVMPYMKHNAREFLRKRADINPLSILRDISLGLEYLHSRKICHGDLKAINVLVDAGGRALLCDFGLSRLKADVMSRTSGNLGVPSIFGSRNWMAPELLTGSTYGMTSDVYAFAMTLYELYADDIPFSSVPYGDFIEVVVNRGARPGRPEQREGRRISDALWDLTEQCWIKDPQLRPTATQIHDSITHLLSDPPEELPGETTPTVESTEELLAFQLTSGPDVDANWDMIPNEGHVNSLTAKYDSSGPDVDANWDMIPNEGHVNGLTAKHDLDLTSGDLRRLAGFQIEIMANRKAKLGNKHPDTLAIMLNLASTYYWLGLFQNAQDLQIHVVDTRTENLGRSHRDTLAAMYNLSCTCRKLGSLEEALTIGSEVVQSRRTSLGHSHLDTLIAVHGLAVTYYRMRRLTEAEKLQMVVVRERQRILGKAHQQTLAAKECLAWVCYDLDQFKRAEKLQLEVLRRRKLQLGKTHPYTLRTAQRLASMYAERGKNVPAKLQK